MPEGHTIHRLARLHRRRFGGQHVAVSSPQGRFTGAAVVDATRFETADAYGKHLFHHYEGGRVVHVHLGLIGAFRDHGALAPAPTPTTRMRVDSSDHTTDLIGPMVCELVTPGEVEDLLAPLGPDPIRTDGDPDRGWAALRRRRVPIGRALLDQKVLAGVGNVYRAEVLFVLGIHPETPAERIDRATWDAIWGQLREWMRRDARSGRIRTVDPDEVGRPRSRFRREDALYVYKRDGCRRCDRPVRRWDLSGRWAYACETCQPPPGAGRSTV